MIQKPYPILEFDPDRNAFIRPEMVVRPADVPENCVLCFFREAIDAILGEYPHRLAGKLHSEAGDTPVYQLDYNGRQVALARAGVGAPFAAAQIEELTALGCRKYIVCGSCGVLRQDIALGHLIIPSSAVRDEGTSYHYAAPAREIEADAYAAEVIERTLLKQNVPYIKAKTWTTDAFYRETPEKIKLRKIEGCVTVEMEASAYMAVAQYLGVTLGQILYAGDNLGGVSWDSRAFLSRTDIRAAVLRLALEACLAL